MPKTKRKNKKCKRTRRQRGGHGFINSLVNNEDPRIGSYALDKNLLKIGQAETLDGFEERKALGDYFAGASEDPNGWKARGWINPKKLHRIGTSNLPPYGFAKPADIRKHKFDKVDLEGIDTDFSIDLTDLGIEPDAGIQPVTRDDVGEYQEFGTTELVTDPLTGETTRQATGFEGAKQTSRGVAKPTESVDLDEAPEAIRFADRVSASVSTIFDDDAVINVPDSGIGVEGAAAEGGDKAGRASGYKGSAILEGGDNAGSESEYLGSAILKGGGKKKKRKRKTKKRKHKKTKRKRKTKRR